jgi:hypothetical protein
MPRHDISKDLGDLEGSERIREDREAFESI